MACCALPAVEVEGLASSNTHCAEHFKAEKCVSRLAPSVRTRNATQSHTASQLLRRHFFPWGGERKAYSLRSFQVGRAATLGFSASLGIPSLLLPRCMAGVNRPGLLNTAGLLCQESSRH